MSEIFDLIREREWRTSCPKELCRTMEILVKNNEEEAGSSMM
jgi:hypothetical protein